MKEKNKRFFVLTSCLFLILMPFSYSDDLVYSSKIDLKSFSGGLLGSFKPINDISYGSSQIFSGLLNQCPEIVEEDYIKKCTDGCGQYSSDNTAEVLKACVYGPGGAEGESLCEEITAPSAEGGHLTEVERNLRSEGICFLGIEGRYMIGFKDGCGEEIFLPAHNVYYDDEGQYCMNSECNANPSVWEGGDIRKYDDSTATCAGFGGGYDEEYIAAIGEFMGNSGFCQGWCCGDDGSADNPDGIGKRCCLSGYGGEGSGQRVFDDWARDCIRKLGEGCLPKYDGSPMSTEKYNPYTTGPCCGDDANENPDMGPNCCASNIGPSIVSPRVWVFETVESEFQGEYTGPCCGDDETDDPDWNEKACTQCKMGDYVGSRVWDSSHRCCGDDNETDDPDMGPECCEKGPLGENVGRQVWTYNFTDRLFDIAKSRGGLCCGDDKTDDSDMSEEACEACVVGDYPGSGKSGSEGPRAWASELTSCCGDDMLSDCMMGSYNGGVCLAFGGSTSQKGNTGFLGIITESESNPPYNTSGSTWYWFKPGMNTIDGQNVNLAGQIINSTCADYMVVSDGSHWLSCNDIILKKEHHVAFDLDDDMIVDLDEARRVQNPKKINTHEYICYSDKPTYSDITDDYYIAECCGNETDNCNSLKNLGGLRHTTGYAVNRTVAHDGETYYCAFDSDWTTDLDNKDAYSCTESGYNWTGSYCCAEDDDRFSANNYLGNVMGEWYNDVGGTGACWNNTYQQNEGYVNEFNGTDTTHTYYELFVLNGVVEGCAVDDRWAEQTNSEGKDYTSPEKAQNKNKPYHGSLGNKTPSDFVQFEISAEHKGNDWLLYLDDNANPGNISIDKSYPNGDNDEMVHDNTYCSYINSGDGYFCSWKEVWTPANGNMERTHLSYIPWSGDNTTQYAECCKPEQCWNGVQCINSQHDDATAEPYPGTNYRCLHGEWQEQAKKYTWDGIQDGYCEHDSQCLVSPVGSEANDGNVTAFYMSWDNTLSNPNYPQCINNGQYVFDHYCDSGKWSTRTKVLATHFLDYANSNSASNYTLYCDSYDKALTDTAYSMGSNFVSDYFGMGCDLSGEYGNYNFINCTGMVCVLRHDDGVSFGIVLNQPVNSENKNILESFGENGQSCNNAIGSDGFTACGAEDLFYDSKNNLLVYHPYGTFSTTVTSDNVYEKAKYLVAAGFSYVFNKIMTVLKIKSASGAIVPSFFLNGTSEFSRLYISKNSGRQVLGIIESKNVKYQGTNVMTDYIVLQYSGFDSNICDSLNLTDVSPNSCSKDGSNYIVRAKKDYWSSSKIFNYWDELTSELRVVE